MTKTRKEIIVLIEPFMERTRYKNKNQESDNKILLTKVQRFQSPKTNKIDTRVTKKLWHYDITAVHKFIVKKKHKDFSIWKYNYHITDKEVISLDYPIKPLHLFSDKEEQELLSLLLRLK